MKTSTPCSPAPPRTARPLQAADQTPHYVQAVVKVAGRSEVLATEDIYAANGMKLLARGARIDASLWQSLSMHTLAKPLDLMLASSDCVDHVSLARDLDKVIAATPLLATMLARTGDAFGWKPVLGSIGLPQAIMFRFTVMRDEAAQLYLHSLRVTVAAYCIGVRLRLPAQQLADLMLASLCHDIGEMHTDPSILAGGRSISGDERRFIHVHPVTGYVILKQLDAIPQAVMRAVLQHHERLDGSGYPNGERGDRIGMLARIIAIAETLDAVAQHLDQRQIPIVFRLHQGRLDQDGMETLTDLLPKEKDPDGNPVAAVDVERRLNRVCNVLQAWPPLRDQIRGTPAEQACRFIDERLMQVQSLVRQSGIAPGLLELLDLREDEAGMLSDLHTTLDEMGRLLDGLAFEIERCIPADGPHGALSARIISVLRE